MSINTFTQITMEEGEVYIGKTRSFDHPSPEYDKLFKHQITRPFVLSIRIGPKWSGGPFFPTNDTSNPFMMVF
jgi:hypothetical protein